MQSAGQSLTERGLKFQQEPIEVIGPKWGTNSTGIQTEQRAVETEGLRAAEGRKVAQIEVADRDNTMDEELRGAGVWAAQFNSRNDELLKSS